MIQAYEFRKIQYNRPVNKSVYVNNKDVPLTVV